MGELRSIQNFSGYAPASLKHLIGILRQGFWGVVGAVETGGCTSKVEQDGVLIERRRRRTHDWLPNYRREETGGGGRLALFKMR